jgi:hypothetical protein
MKACILGETARRTTKRRTQLRLLLSVAIVFTAHLPVGAQPYIYPARGQSPQQEESDKGQCYGWAVQQSGFDPANPQVAMPPPPPRTTRSRKLRRAGSSGEPSVGRPWERWEGPSGAMRERARPSGPEWEVSSA